MVYFGLRVFDLKTPRDTRKKTSPNRRKINENTMSLHFQLKMKNYLSISADVVMGPRAWNSTGVSELILKI